ncbi:MAG: hypothetical protein ACREQQ_02730, partial [Candidatus Binatia bacterium]
MRSVLISAIALLAPAGWLLLALHVAYVFVLGRRTGRSLADAPVETVVWLAAGVSSLLLAYAALNLATESRPRLRTLANLSYLLVYGALA